MTPSPTDRVRATIVGSLPKPSWLAAPGELFPPWVLTLTMMGAVTFLIGLVPTYESIGIAAPLMIVVLRPYIVLACCVSALAAMLMWRTFAAPALAIALVAADLRRG
ncbi:MAG TPA: hypothetical protein VMB73_07570 [Acetobacteraceae bacterium]|jgi:hypothetical protein|nr:hypothetical protein [Acetobacteraceae bacterium]